MTTRLSAVDHLFITGTKRALRSWLLTSVPTPICLCKPFSCRACPGICFRHGNTFTLKDVWEQDTSHHVTSHHIITPNHITEHRTTPITPNTCLIQNPDTIGQSVRGGARQGGGSGRGWVGRDAVESIRPGNNPPSCPPANREDCSELLFGSTNSLNST